MWAIKSIEINGGFLPGVTVELPDGLTCIIGPRGSGKSTLAELVRFAICGLSGAPKSRQEIIQANLGNAGLVTLKTSVRDGLAYTVRRGLRQQPSLTTSDNKTIASVDLERGTFLPLDAYTGPEIEAIADESLGERRRLLLDELRQDDLRRVQARIAEHRRKLEANADEISSLTRDLANTNEEIEEIGDIKARLEALPPPPPDGRSAELMKASRQAQMNSRELGGIQKVQEVLQGRIAALERLFREGAEPNSANVVVPDSENESILRQLSGVLEMKANEFQLAIGECLNKLKQTLAELQQWRDQLEIPHRAQAEKLLSIQKLNQEIGQAVRERTEVEQKLSRLEEIQRKQTVLRAELEKKSTERQTIRADFLLERDEISTIRGDVAAWLQKEAGNQIQVRVIRNADDLSYRSLLLEGLKGARVRNHEEILTELLTIRPEELGQMIQTGGADALESMGHFGTERSQRIIEAFKQNLNPHELETVQIDDQVRIELNVSTGPDPLFKDAADLSRGQKCTALLPLLLARRDSPLIIDQPEDNLDNHFIYETVVATIKRLKNRRQMIFITHNANIPVLAEAERVIVLNSDGKSGFVEKTGSVDDCKEQIIDLLEGGREAFELRRKRYV
jgi:energy-coupling factor transporter ATP-binding protein EcfA2